MEKPHHQLRAILLKLHERLSDYDRERLHFFLANDVPRHIRDNATSSGTLHLLESLFDQDKISDEDFTFLINAFSRIQCLRAVRLLQEHKKRIQSRWFNEPNEMVTELTLSEQVILDQEDKGCSQVLLHPKQHCSTNNKGLSDNKTTTKSVITTLNQKKILNLRSEQNQLFYIPLKINKFLIFMVLLLILVLGVMTIIFCFMKTDQSTTNTKIKDLGGSILTRDTYIQQLQDQIADFESEKKSALIKAGKRFGGRGGDYFDNSLLPGFTRSHYVNEISVSTDKDDDVKACVFYYTCHPCNKRSVQTPTYGDEELLNIPALAFDKNDKIEQVKVYMVNVTNTSLNGTNPTATMIVGLQFISKNHMNSPAHHGRSDILETESFPGYTLGYVTGRATSEHIEQLQFFWYRTLETD